MTPRTATKGLLAPATLALLLLSMSCSGKGAQGTCTDGAVCGGNPTGVWDVAGSCEYRADRPDQPLGPREQVQTPVYPALTPSQGQQTTTGDWCSQLFYSVTDNRPVMPSKVKTVNLWHDAPTLTGGQVSFNDGSIYNVALNFATYDVSHFAPLCLQTGGANPTCADLQQNLAEFYTSLAGKDGMGNPLPASFVNIQCQGATDGGCDCGYDYQVALTDTGTWSSGGSILTESSDPSGYLFNGTRVGSEAPSGFMVASFCQNGDALNLSGYNGSTLSHAPGLRVLTLHRHM
jgi:hypothetical protein